MGGFIFLFGFNFGATLGDLISIGHLKMTQRASCTDERLQTSRIFVFLSRAYYERLTLGVLASGAITSSWYGDYVELGIIKNG